jgi:hypothetical protein
MLRDFRESLAEQLRDDESRRLFVQAGYDEDGLAGVRLALDELARVDAWNEGQGHVTPARVAKHATGLPKPNAQTDADFAALRTALKEEGLDFRVVPTSE